MLAAPSEGSTPAPTAEKTLRKRSTATDGGRIPQVGRPRVAWTRERTRALLSVGKRCNPLKRGFGSRLVELWAAEHPNLPATANALVQKFRLVRRDIGAAQTELACTPAKRVRSGGFFDTPPPKRKQCESRLDPASLIPIVVSPKRSNRGNPDEYEKSVSEVLPLLRRYYAGQTRNNPGVFKTRVHVISKWTVKEKQIAAAEGAAMILWNEERNKSLWSLNCLVYSVAATLAEAGKNVAVTKVKKADQSVAPQMTRYRKLYDWLGAEIGRQEARKKITPRVGKIRIMLRRKYRTLDVGKLRAEREKVRGLMKIKTAKCRRRKRAQLISECNRRYRKRGLKSILVEQKGENSEKDLPSPNIKEVEEFWWKVVGVREDVPTHPIVRDWETSMNAVLADDGDLDITKPEWRRVIKKAAPWKAPGPDKIHPFWYKHLPQISEVARQMSIEILNGRRDIPKWLVQGRTVLMPKPGCKGEPSKYRPIACLNSAYKLITATLANKLCKHVEDYDIMPQEQRSMMRGRRGCFDALMIDRAVTESAKVERDDLSVAWIDFQKAYDRVPHSWIVRMLKIIKAPEKMVELIRRLTERWTTVFEVRSATGVQRTKAVKYRRGLFQGDALSPLIFCLSIVPISIALRNYQGIVVAQRGAGLAVTHVLYMDDLKLYASTREELDRMVDTVTKVGQAVGMALGSNKCATATMRKGRPVADKAIRLAENEVVSNLGSDENYRYLGVEQLFDPNLRIVRSTLAKVVTNRAGRVAKLMVSGKNKSLITNSWIVAKLRYYLAAVRWSKRELISLDRAVRRRFRATSSCHRNSAVERFHIARKEGGRGIGSALLVYEREQVSAAIYLVKTKDELLETVVSHQMSMPRKYPTVLSEATKVLEKYDLGFEISSESSECNKLTPKTAAMMVKSAQHERMVERWRGKKLHGPFRKTIESKGIDRRGSFLWLTKGRFSARSEALIQAAQDGVIHTAAFKAHVLKRDCSPLCRWCGESNETVGHLLSACKEKCWTFFKERHDRILARLLWHISMSVRGTVSERVVDATRYVTRIGEFAETWGSNRVTVDTNVPTEREVGACRPDIVLYLLDRNAIVIFEVACAWDPNVLAREQEKWLKYTDLAADLKIQYPQCAVLVVPVVVGTLGVVGGLRKRLRQCKIFRDYQLDTVISDLQYEAITGGIRILKSHQGSRGDAVIS